MDPTNIPQKLVGSEDERAVSPVIGVILMVAITVILAAVIAAFVLDIGPGDATVSAAADVSVDTNADNDEIAIVEVTSGGGDLDGLALVDADGNVKATTEGDSVNTGGTYELEPEDYDADSDDFTVYGYSGTHPDDDGGSIDEAGAHAELGSVELEEDE